MKEDALIKGSRTDLSVPEEMTHMTFQAYGMLSPIEVEKQTVVAWGGKKAFLRDLRVKIDSNIATIGGEEEFIKFLIVNSRDENLQDGIQEYFGRFVRISLRELLEGRGK